MTRSLTDKDRGVLKYEKRIGYVFSGLVICFGGLFNLIYFLLNKTGPDYLVLSLTDLGVLFLAYFVCNRVNLKVNRDLKDNVKELLKRRVDKKIVEKSYEAGSGTLYIPILGDLFPRVWGQKMNERKKYFIYSNDYRHEVEEEMYNYLKKGDEFYIHMAKNSGIVLSFSRNE